MDSLLTKYTPFIKSYALPLSLGILGMMLIGYGLISSFSQGRNNNDIMFTSGTDSTQSEKTAENIHEITVDVEGAVAKPGVYKLKEGARFADALEEAGGISTDADSDLIGRQINLAAKLVDGAKVYIPDKNEMTLINSATGETQSSDSLGVPVNNLININSAGSAELDTLSGIGPVTAQKIIDNRPFQTVDELLSKKVLSASVFEKIKDKITVY